MTTDATPPTPSPAEIRAEAESRLIPGGKRRRKLLEQLDDIDTELRPLILAARRAEVSLRRIQDLTGVTPNTIRAMEQRARAAGGDTTPGE